MILLYILFELECASTRPLITTVHKNKNILLYPNISNDDFDDYCLYHTNQTLCGDTSSLGPSYIALFKINNFDINKNIRIFVSEPILLQTPLLIGNMKANHVTFHGFKVSGKIFIAHNYFVRDESGVFSDADITIECSYFESSQEVALSINESIITPPKSLSLLLIDTPSYINIKPVSHNFYIGPEVHPNVVIDKISTFGGIYKIDTRYFGNNLKFIGYYIATTQKYCFCSKNSQCGECKNEIISSFSNISINLFENTTLVYVEIVDNFAFIDFEELNSSMNYLFNGTGNNTLTLKMNEELIAKFNTLTFSNLILDFQSLNHTLNILSPLFVLSNTKIAPFWKDRISIHQLITDINSIENITINNQDQPIIITPSADVQVYEDNILFDSYNLPKQIKNVMLLSSSSFLNYTDNTGARMIMSPFVDNKSQRKNILISINSLKKTSEVVFSKYENLQLQLNQKSNNITIKNIKDFECFGFGAIELSGFDINGTHGSRISTNTYLHFEKLTFEDKNIQQPDEMLAINSRAKVEADEVYIGLNNANLIYNINIKNNLTLQPHSVLECANCTFSSASCVNLVMGKITPPPILILSLDSKDYFKPKNITIHINSLFDSNRARYNIINKKYYDIITGFSSEEQCQRSLKAIVDLPADYEVRCLNGHMQINTGDIFDIIDVHYTIGETVGMVFASIVCAVFSYLVHLLI